MSIAIDKWRNQRTSPGDTYLVRYVWNRNASGADRGIIERVIDVRPGIDAINIAQAFDNPNAIDIKIRVSTIDDLGTLLPAFVFQDPDDDVPLHIEGPVILLTGVLNMITTGWDLIEDTAREAARGIGDTVASVPVPTVPQINFGLASIAVIVVGGFLIVRSLT